MLHDPNSPFQYLQLEQIQPSRTNPRKRFPEEKMKELAENIKAHGVMQPILVRPVDKHGKPIFGEAEGVELDHYEIVAGERRYRASKMAGEAGIPAVIRELHDLDTLQLQIYENLHREDLHPIEEAEGFQYLLDKSNKLVGMTVDQLAEKIGKSRSYIFASLKLLNLCTYARDVFYDNKIGREIAVLVARIPGEALQTKALKEILEPRMWSDGPMSYRQAAKHVQERYTLNLSKAVFKITDADLLPAAGCCRSCPKRTGNYPELYPDISSPDVCTNPDCFAAKRDAHVQQLEASGKQVIKGPEAKKIMPNTWEVKGDFVKVEDNCPGRPESFQKLLGKDMPETATLVTDTGDVVQLVKKEAVIEALKEKGIEVKFREETDYSAKQREEEKKARLENQYRRNVLGAISHRLYEQGRGEFEDHELTLVAKAMFKRLDNECTKRLLKLRNPDLTGEHYEAARKLEAEIDNNPRIMSRSDLLQLIIQCALVGDCYVNTYSMGSNDGRPLFFMAEQLKVDIKAIRAKTEAELAPKKKGKQPATAEPASPPPPAAQAQEQTAPETAGQEDAQPEAQASAGDPAAQAEDENLPPGFAKAKKKVLARKAKEQKQKVPAKAGGNDGAAAAAIA